MYKQDICQKFKLFIQMLLNWYRQQPRNVDDQLVYRTPHFVHLYHRFRESRLSKSVIYIQVTSCIVEAGMFELLCLGLALRFSLYWEQGNSFGDTGIDSHGVSSFPICAGLSTWSYHVSCLTRNSHPGPLAPGHCEMFHFSFSFGLLYLFTVIQ